jgi:hypothetical protein
MKPGNDIDGSVKGHGSKRVGTLGSAFALLIGLMLLVPMVSSDVSGESNNWFTSTLDSENDVGMFSSIAVDSNGQRHISYYDESFGRLMYAYTNEGVWLIQIGDNVGDVGMYSSIAVDSMDQVHISYYDSTNGNLKYANNTGGEWTTRVVDQVGDVGQFTSVTIDSTDHAHISYYDVANGNMKYATNAGGNWTAIAVESGGDVGRYTSIATDLSDKVHISYYDASNGNLNYATNALGGTWSISPLDSAGNVGKWSSIVIEEESVHISYYDTTNTALKYATDQGGEWATETISDEQVGEYSSMVLGLTTGYHISCYDAEGGDLVYFTKEGGDWTEESIDAEGEVGLYTSIARDGQDNLYISYYDAENSNLKYAYTMNQMPSPPINANASGGDGHIMLTWEEPENPGWSPVSSYIVNRGTSPESLFFWTQVNETSFNDTNVVNGHPYYYEIIAVNEEYEGVPSDIVWATPTEQGQVPSEPQNLAADAAGVWVHLNWDPPVNSGASPIIGYNLYRGINQYSFTLYQELGQEFEYNDTDVVNGQTYYYRVSAINEQGEGEGSNVISATPFSPVEPTPPSVPQNLTLQVGDGYISLAWQAPASDGGSPVTNYKVYRGTSPDSITLLTTIGDIHQYNDSSVESGNTYYYRVSAFNSMGEGDSASANAQTGGGGDIDPMILVIVGIVIVIIVVLVYFLMRGGGQQGQQKTQQWPPKNSGRRKEKW